jgi:hypothetical protein
MGVNLGMCFPAMKSRFRRELYLRRRYRLYACTPSIVALQGFCFLTIGRDQPAFQRPTVDHASRYEWAQHDSWDALVKRVQSVLNFSLIMPYPAKHRIDLGAPFVRRAEVFRRQKLCMQIAVANLNHVIDHGIAPPFPESTPVLPTDSADHWQAWFRAQRVDPPVVAIASFVLYLRRLIDAVGGRPVRPIAQTNSSSSGSAQTRTPQDARCCVIS